MPARRRKDRELCNEVAWRGVAAAFAAIEGNAMPLISKEEEEEEEER